MTTLNQEIENQFSAANTTIITAVPLDIPTDHPLRSKGYAAILPSWCVCVTDPCPCKDPDGPIVWLLDQDIRTRHATKRKNKSGESLFEYHIDQDAVVITETFTRTKVTALNAHTTLRRLALERLKRQAPGSGYAGQDCGGGTLYDVWYESDGAGGTTFYYIPVGSCPSP